MSADETLSGELAPPMANGEVVFEAPWQGRLFGMACAMAASGVFEWDEFRDRLIDEIAAWDRQPSGEFRYYDHFLAAFERLLEDKGLVSAAGVSRRLEDYLARPHGHDH